MRSIVTFDVGTLFICHFASQEGMPGMPYYQAYFKPEETQVSPDGFFVRFSHDEHCEIHGWRPVEDIVIDCILEEEQVSEGGKWKALST